MRAVETAVKQAAMANSLKWFGKQITSEDVIEEKFNVMLRHPKKEKGSAIVDTERPPTLTVKIPKWKGVWKPEIYDEDGEPLYINGKVNSHIGPLEFLKPKSHIISLLQCGGLWFVNGKISITWNLIQAIVQKPKATMEGTCFLKPKAVDKERMKALPPPEDPVEESVGAIVEDSDDEQEYVPAVVVPPVPEPVPEPEPVAVEEKKPVKRVVKKKADA
jgi:hypothetical protein